MAVFEWRGINSAGRTVKGVRDADNPKALRVLLRREGVLLTEVLEEAYGPDQEVVVYEAAIHWLLQPVIDRMPLRDLADARISHVSTLYIPPARDIEFDPDMAARIGWSA